MAIRSNLNKRINTLLSTRQRQSYALVAVTVFITLVLIGVGVFPIISSILYQVEQNRLKSDVLARMETKEQNLRTLVSTETQKREVTLALDAAFPDTLEQSEFIESVNELAIKNQTTIVFISFAEIQERRVTQELFSLSTPVQGKTVSIGANGGRAGLQQFFAEIESLRRIANVLSVSLARREENGVELIPQGQEYSINIQAEIYFIGE